MRIMKSRALLFLAAAAAVLAFSACSKEEVKKNVKGGHCIVKFV